MAARIEKGSVKLLTRSGLDWTARYLATAAAFARLKVKSAYIDGELCGVRSDGVTSFELMQTASDRGGAPPPRETRFGRPLELAKAHWVRPELVVEITYLSWPEDGLLRHTVFLGLREDKPASEVRRETGPA